MFCGNCRLKKDDISLPVIIGRRMILYIKVALKLGSTLLCLIFDLTGGTSNKGISLTTDTLVGYMQTPNF